MKRFWQEARAVPGADGFSVTLDGKPVRLPSGQALLVASPRLAGAVAEEWAGLGPEFDWPDLRLTRLAGTAQERIAPDREPVAMALARYAESDLLCYRATAAAALAERQQGAWQPWLDWAEREFGARLTVTTGVRHVGQDSAALAILAGVVAGCDAPVLAGLGVLVPALGSLVLALAVARGVLAPAEAFRLSVLDEAFQAEQWGIDPQAAARAAEIEIDIDEAARFVQLARS